jgi:quercetin dioxygenase-like cupin family protein/DNA-binding Xre family transcriptional regulator
MHRAGPRLREIRQGQHRSLAEVAQRAGITKGFLSQAERGLTRVSVPTLLAICRALEVTIGALFDYPETTVVGAGTVLQMGGLGVTEFLLTPANQGHLQVMRTIVQPSGGSGGTYRLDSEAVFAFVLRGALQITVDGEQRVVNAGQSTTYPARSDHGWRNGGDTETEVLFVFAPPLPSLPG